MRLIELFERQEHDDGKEPVTADGRHGAIDPKRQYALCDSVPQSRRSTARNGRTSVQPLSWHQRRQALHELKRRHHHQGVFN